MREFDPSLPKTHHSLLPFFLPSLVAVIAPPHWGWLLPLLSVPLPLTRDMLHLRLKSSQLVEKFLGLFGLSPCLELEVPNCNTTAVSLWVGECSDAAQRSVVFSSLALPDVNMMQSQTSLQSFRCSFEQQFSASEALSQLISRSCRLTSYTIRCSDTFPQDVRCDLFHHLALSKGIGQFPGN